MNEPWEPEFETLKVGDVCIIFERSHHDRKGQPYVHSVFNSEQGARRSYGEVPSTVEVEFLTVPLFVNRLKPNQRCDLEHSKGVKCPNEDRGCDW